MKVCKSLIENSIVAVHGIGADATKTWSSNGVDWLSHSQMLPAWIPTARIMRFSYKSQWIGEGAIPTSLTNVAKKLLYALNVKRRVSKKSVLLHCMKLIKL